MNTIIESLPSEHKVLARAIWQALYNAPTPNDLVAARLRFDAAPQEVKDAILIASVREGLQNSGEAESNPFDF